MPLINFMGAEGFTIVSDNVVDTGVCDSYNRAALVAVLEKTGRSLPTRVAQHSPEPRIEKDHRADYPRSVRLIRKISL